MNHRLALDLFLEVLALFPINKDFRNAPFQHFFLGIVAQHAHQGGVDVHNGSVRSRDVNAFLERFEEFREAGFVLAERGDVARENGDAMDFAIAQHGMRHTVEVKERPLSFQPNLDDASPLPAFHETWHRTANQLGPVSAAFLQEVRNGFSNNLLEGRVDEIGKTAVSGANLPVKRKCEQNIIE